MTEQLKRRNLLGALEPKPQQLPDSAISAAAVRNGFAPVDQDARVQRDLSIVSVRRHRQPTGRVHQFNVRLRADTLEAIYAHANGRNIPVAQVIEEAVEALNQKGRPWENNV